MKKFKIGLPAIAILLVVLAALFIDLDLRNWKKQERVIEHDVHSYYAYLPLVFIYNDIQIIKDKYVFKNLAGKDNDYYWFWPSKTKEGNNVIKTTCGLSIMYSPFFFIAHLVTPLTHHPADGFSPPYKQFLLLAALFYFFIGLYFLVKILRLYEFKDKTIFLTILLIGLGTNLLGYSSQSGTMPHVYGFCLFSGFIYNTIKWYKTGAVKHVIYLGLLFGLITLIRPTNGVIVLFFLFYNITSFADIKNRLLLFKNKFFVLLLTLPLTLFVWAPQFWYWKIVSGNFMYYSYGDESFYFLDPRIIEGLFSFRKGWLVYTPMMIFAIVGIFFLKNKAKETKNAIIIFTTINLYIIFSWWCWWYGGSFGQRTIIASYALLAIPFASFIKWIEEKKAVFKWPFYAIAIFFIWLNIIQIYQFEKLSLHHDSMTSELYFKQFGKIDRIEGFLGYLDWMDYDKEKYRGVKAKDNPRALKITDDYQLVSLKAANGRYLCREWNGFVIANKKEANAWEEYKLIFREKEGFMLASYDNKFFSLEEEQLVAMTDNVEKAHYFDINFINDSTITILTQNGFQLGIEPVTDRIILVEESTDGANTFVLEKK